MFNSAYSTGGAACAVKTVESITGIRMDHYLEVDFSGFEKLIDELGGVKVTTTKAIDDTESHLNLKAGTHTLNGEQALGLVRTRHGVGDGSDLGRIQLQQAFIKALINQVKSVGVFDEPQEALRPRRTPPPRPSPPTPTSARSTSSSSFASGLKGISAVQHEHGHDAGRVRPGEPEPRDRPGDQGQAGLDGPGERPGRSRSRPPKGNATGEAEGVVTAG